MCAADENVPNFVKSEGGGHYEVSYTPQLHANHVVHVRFNGALVPGGSRDVMSIDRSPVNAWTLMLSAGSPFLVGMEHLDMVDAVRRDSLIRLPVDQIATLSIDSRSSDARDVIEQMSVGVSCTELQDTHVLPAS